MPQCTPQRVAGPRAPSLPWALAALLLVAVGHAGPINRQAGSQNNLRLDSRNQSYTEQNVCVNDDVLYQAGDPMPAPSPCARCVCRPPSSHCEPIACDARPGCKALQRPNQCCPEYQCECERNGRVYQNGERLDNAESPCEVCYCQGGEVVCTAVECYRRDDCEPQIVPGRCCPKYDHCPPLVMEEARQQHSQRASFPDGDQDQAVGASTVQERVHIPSDPAPAPASTLLLSADATTPDPDITEEPAATQSPQEIRIDVPAIPWPEAEVSATTNAPASTNPPAPDTTIIDLEDISADPTETPNNQEDIPANATDTMKLESTTEGNGGEGARADEGVTITTLPPAMIEGSGIEEATPEVEEATTAVVDNMELPQEMLTAAPEEQGSGNPHSMDMSTEVTMRDEISSDTSTGASPELKDLGDWPEELLHDSSSSSSSSSSSGFPSSLSSTSEVLSTSLDERVVRPVSGSDVSFTDSDSTELPSTTESAEQRVKGSGEKEPVTIVLDVTEEEGPPILLIGDDLANHQMDIVVATMPNDAAADPTTQAPPSSQHEMQKDVAAVAPESTSQVKGEEKTVPADKDGKIPTAVKEEEKMLPLAIEEEKRTIVIEEAAPVEEEKLLQVQQVAETTTEVSDETTTAVTTAINSEEKPQDEPQEMVLSDDPLPGQYPEEVSLNKLEMEYLEEQAKREKEAAQNAEKKQEAPPGLDLKTLLALEDAASSSEVKETDLPTEAPEREATTNKIADEGVTEQAAASTPAEELPLGDEAKEDPKEDPSALEEKRFEEVTTSISSGGEEGTGTTVQPDDVTEEELLKTSEDLTSGDSSAPVVQAQVDPKEDGQKNEPEAMTTERERDEAATTSPTTTQPTATEKPSRVKDFTNEQMMLRDEPQSDSTALPSPLSGEKKDDRRGIEQTDKISHILVKQNEKIGEKELTLSETEKPDDSEELSTPASTSMSSGMRDGDATTEVTTESITNEEMTEMTTFKTTEDVKEEAEKEETTDEAKNESVEANKDRVGDTKQEMKDEVKDEKEEVRVEEQEANEEKEEEKEEALSSSEMIQDEAAEKKDEVAAEKMTKKHVTEGTIEATTEPLEMEATEDSQAGAVTARINPEVFELPVASLPGAPANIITNINTTDSSPLDIDATTPPSQWLKADNETKTEEEQKKEGEEMQSMPEHEPAPAALKANVGDGGSDDVDKKDLFILEDFFSKLYRHQIATDTAKH